METLPGAPDYGQALMRLVEVVQELSLARDMDRIMAIVRRAARELTGADGATFVLRDGAFCYYADEDAIAPLWKGQRFPMDACVSGWSMLNRQAVTIEHIYDDDRVLADAYRPTFVESLVMVPIRTAAPVGAIGNYWASHHVANAHEVALLAALADSTSIAIENVELYRTLERRVQERTAELVASQSALEAEHAALVRLQRHKQDLTAWLMHDLKSPASGIMLSATAQLRKAHLTDSDRRYWKNIFAGAEVINRMASNLMDLTRDEQAGLRAKKSPFDLNALLEETVEVMSSLAFGQEQGLALKLAPPETIVIGDRELLRRVLQNLIDNAFRFNRPTSPVCVQAQRLADAVEVRVIDTGPGIPEAQRKAVFDRYERLPSAAHEQVSAGHGLGLTFCRLVIESHGGSIWVEPNEPHGSVFVLRLPLDC